MLDRSPLVRSRSAPLFTPTVVKELAQIETDVGGRAALVGMLALAPLTKDLQYVLGLLGDPQRKGESLAELCAAANVLPGELLKHLAQAAMQRGRILAAQRIGAGMPAVVEDIMRRAAPFEDACHACLGTGSVVPDPTPETPNPVHQPCETCQGAGKLKYQPDLERQKLAVELSQLLPKGGGIQIAMQQNNVPGGGSGSTLGMGSLERLQMATDRILYGDELPGASMADPGDLEPDGHSAPDQPRETAECPEGEILPPEDV